MRAVLTAVFSCALAVAEQNSRAAMEQSIARQRAAIEVQRATVRAQARGVSEEAAAASFFTVPWHEELGRAEVPTPDCEPMAQGQIGSIVNEATAREGLAPGLLDAVIEQESSYQPCAVSSKGAQGLMQLMPATAGDLGVTNPFDPRQNVDAGAKFLKQLIDRYGGNVALALAAYNAGPNRVDSAGGVPALPETMGYVAGILDKLGIAEAKDRSGSPW
jgi:soluble lytic murein transglycosylase-like protein